MEPNQKIKWNELLKLILCFKNLSIPDNLNKPDPWNNKTIFFGLTKFLWHDMTWQAIRNISIIGGNNE